MKNPVIAASCCPRGLLDLSDELELGYRLWIELLQILLGTIGRQTFNLYDVHFCLLGCLVPI